MNHQRQPTVRGTSNIAQPPVGADHLRSGSPLCSYTGRLNETRKGGKIRHHVKHTPDNDDVPGAGLAVDQAFFSQQLIGFFPIIETLPGNTKISTSFRDIPIFFGRGE
jgi:hypothetical protein